MSYELDEAATRRLQDYFGQIGEILGDRRRRASFAIYAFGILGDGERKSAEPIAARACAGPESAEAMHTQMLTFLSRSNWEDEPVRRLAIGYALGAMQRREEIRAWIVDDTGFLKQGRHSVGVQRQYTGSAGKTTNCQIGVSLTACTATEQLPLDMQLYLPESWTGDPIRRKRARIPDDVIFRPKWRIALDMIEAAVQAGFPVGVLLGDAAYGNVAEFRDGVHSAGLDYAVDVQSTTVVRRVFKNGREGKAQSLFELARSLPRKAFRKVTWREGTRKTLWSRFARMRVRVQHSDGQWRGEQWLLIEWPESERDPTHYVLATVPENTTRRQLVRIVKQRWRIERTYEDLKGELGLDHFEGRSFPGWNHHVTVVLCCYAFIISERVRHFPPTAERSSQTRTVSCAA